jgi:hypothetical protein
MRCGNGLYLVDGLLFCGRGFGAGFEVGDGFFCGRFFVFVFFFFKIFAGPGIFAELGLVYGAGIDDYAGLDDGLEIDAAQVGGGGLQGVEQQAGGFGVYLSAEDEAHDLHERDLDGVGVFEHGQIERGAAAAGAVGVEDDTGFVPAFVEIAKVIAFQGGRSALGAVDFKVLATGNASGI